MIGCLIAKLPTNCTTIEDEATRIYFQDITPALKFPYILHLNQILEFQSFNNYERQI